MSRDVKTIRFDSEQLGYITVSGRILNLTEASGILTTCYFSFEDISKCCRQSLSKRIVDKTDVSLVLAVTKLRGKQEIKH